MSRKPMLEALEDRTAPAVLQVAPAVVPTVTLATKVAVAPAVVKALPQTVLIVVPAFVQTVTTLMPPPAKQPAMMPTMAADGPGGPDDGGRASPLPDLLFAGKMLPGK